MTAYIPLLDALLGLFLALPLLSMSRTRHANGWLGLFVLAMSLLAIGDYCDAAQVYLRHPRMWANFDWPIASIGPLFYCYARSITGLGNGRKQLWHFIPQLCFLAILIPIWLFVPTETLRASLLADKPGGFDPFLFAFQCLTAIYAGAVLFRLRQYQRRLRANYSSLKKRDLSWLGWATAANLMLMALWMPASMLRGNYMLMLDVGRVAMLYLLGWYGMRQASVFLPPSDAPVEKATSLEVNQVLGDQAQDSSQITAYEDEATDKYARSGMNDLTKDAIGKRLNRRMDIERDFLNGDLKLTDLAERVGTSPQLLSQYLNEVLGLSFFDYVNSLRVAEVQRLMLADVECAQTLLQLAIDAGFNSKSTFNVAFKKISGLSPSAWRERFVRASEPIG